MCAASDRPGSHTSATGRLPYTYAPDAPRFSISFRLESDVNPFKIEYPRYPSSRPLDDTDRNILREIAEQERDDEGEDE